MKFRTFFWQALIAAWFLHVAEAHGWGAAGHDWIAQAALRQLQPDVRAGVMEILGAPSEERLASKARASCIWPDTIRDQPQWTWSAPQHYVNLPRHSQRYDRQRDCPDGRCAPEAILKYAASLAQPELDRIRRRQAFGWLCHLVADLHQPLHAGFRDDRGGNRIEVQYRGERYNLHQFWDGVLADVRPQERGEEAFAGLRSVPLGSATPPWKPDHVRDWTEESHALAIEAAYPDDRIISEPFADASWQITRRQWQRAADRLASMLNTILAADSKPRGQD
jgi:hypothetical protein